MKIEEERKAFEEYLFLTEKFKFRNKSFLFMLDENGEYEDEPVLRHWETWLASANRQGYKLVPVEPADKMSLRGYHALERFVSMADVDIIYKAMITAFNDH